MPRDSHRFRYEDLDPSLFMTVESLRALRDGFMADGAKSQDEANADVAKHLTREFFKCAHCDDDDSSGTRPSTELRRFRALQVQVVEQAIKKGVRDMLKTAAPSRVPKTHDTYMQTAWMKLYNNRDPVKGPRNRNSALGKLWYSRFRLPIELFDRLVDVFKERGWFRQLTIFGSVSAPVELKLMATLRWLGRGECLDTLAELTVKKIASLAPEFIRPPRTEEEIQRVLALYAEASLPGCIGSTDGVQFLWHAAPAKVRHGHVRKGSKPSVGYNITVGRDLRCHFVSNLWQGKHDVTKLSFDSWVHELRTSPRFKDRKFKVFNKKGDEVELTGLYLLSDNGYPLWEVLQQPPSDSTDGSLMLWAEWLEASQKDVDRFFGVLKARWRILKVPFKLQSIVDIDNVVRATIVLHNWYHDYRVEKEAELGSDPAAAMGVVDGYFPEYPTDERAVLEAAGAAGRRRKFISSAGEQVVALGTGEGRSRRVEMAERFDSTVESGVADGALDTFTPRVSDYCNVRPPPADADDRMTAVASDLAPSERARCLAKRRALAEHVAFLQRAGKLRWVTCTRSANMPTGQFVDIGERLMNKFVGRNRGHGSQ